MREYYEPVLNLSDPEHHNTMGVILALKDPVDGEILRSAVEALRSGLFRKERQMESLFPEL